MHIFLRWSAPAAAAAMLHIAAAAQESKPAGPAPARAAGAVVAVGGGAMPDRIYRRMMEMSARPEPNVLILPLAAAEPGASGPAVDLRFRENGAKNVEWRAFARRDASDDAVLDAIRNCNILFFPGGDQKRILEIVRGTPAQAAIAAVLARGGVVGGTSAGCEVLGELSLTGSGSTRTDLAVAGASEVESGLRLVPGVIFDQHFLARGRFLRLLSATLDARRHVGVGIDESTAIVIPHGTRTMEVIGERQVAVFRVDDGTTAPGAKSGDLARAGRIQMHLLAEGDRYDLDRDVVAFAPDATKAPEPARGAGAASKPAAAAGGK